MKRTQTVPLFLVALTTLARPALGQAPPAAGATPGAPDTAAPTPALSSITGVAIDTATQKPVAGVVVTLSSPSLAGSEQTVVTDATGTYTFKDLPAGSYQVRFKKSAFKPITRDIAIEGGKTFTADADLLPNETAASSGVATRSPSAITGVAVDTTSKKPAADVVVTLT